VRTIDNGYVASQTEVKPDFVEPNFYKGIEPLQNNTLANRSQLVIDSPKIMRRHPVQQYGSNLLSSPGNQLSSASSPTPIRERMQHRALTMT
jgi:hypothetical protein